MAERFIDRLNEYITRKGYNTFSISEARDEDSIVTIDRIRTNPCQDVYSVSKLYATTALGLLRDRGGVCVGEKLCDILWEFVPKTGMDERWRMATVENALQHRLGLPGSFLDIDVNSIYTFGRDFLEYTFKQPLTCAPGTDYCYTDAAFYLICRVVAARTGMQADDYLWKNLLFAIGTQEMAWAHDPMGYPIGGSAVYTRSSDMARLGLVYLNRGTWKGKRLLSEEWVDSVFAGQYGIDMLHDGGIYCKGGMYGQKLIILPKQHRVVSVLSFGADTDDIVSWCYENE